MTSSEKKIVRALIALAWADGRIERAEAQVLEDILRGFDASDADAEEMLAYARQRRSLDEDIPAAELSAEEKEILLANAAVLMRADGEVSASEVAILNRLVTLLEFDRAEAEVIFADARDGAVQLKSDTLE